MKTLMRFNGTNDILLQQINSIDVKPSGEPLNYYSDFNHSGNQVKCAFNDELNNFNFDVNHNDFELCSNREENISFYKSENLKKSVNLYFRTYKKLTDSMYDFDLYNMDITNIGYLLEFLKILKVDCIMINNCESISLNKTIVKKDFIKNIDLIINTIKYCKGA